LTELWRSSILIIGNEVLIGRVVDTNSAKVARTLTMLGYEIIEIRKVRDNITEIAENAKDLLHISNVLITTGGLGPTYDDVTAEALSLALVLPLGLNERAKEMVEEKIKKMGLDMTKERLKMAIMPLTAKPIPNPVGVAPGIYIKVGQKRVFALPGVPAEVEAMLDYVVEELEDLSLFRKGEACEVLEGVREADIAPLIEEMAKTYPDIYIKTHPGMKDGTPYVKVCALATADDEETAKRKASKVVKAIKGRLGA